MYFQETSELTSQSDLDSSWFPLIKSLYVSNIKLDDLGNNIFFFEVERLC